VCELHYSVLEKQPSSTLYTWWARLTLRERGGVSSPGIGYPTRVRFGAHFQSCSAGCRGQIPFAWSTVPPDTSFASFSIPLPGDGAIILMPCPQDAPKVGLSPCWQAPASPMLVRRSSAVASVFAVSVFYCLPTEEYT
jgi:hypothetical protein